MQIKTYVDAFDVIVDLGFLSHGSSYGDLFWDMALILKPLYFEHLNWVIIINHQNFSFFLNSFFTKRKLKIVKQPHCLWWQSFHLVVLEYRAEIIFCRWKKLIVSYKMKNNIRKSFFSNLKLSASTSKENCILYYKK